MMVECDGTNGGGRVVSCQHLCCAGREQNVPAYSCHRDCLEESHTNVIVHTYIRHNINYSRRLRFPRWTFFFSKVYWKVHIASFLLITRGSVYRRGVFRKHMVTLSSAIVLVKSQ